MTLRGALLTLPDPAVRDRRSSSAPRSCRSSSRRIVICAVQRAAATRRASADEPVLVRSLCQIERGRVAAAGSPACPLALVPIFPVVGGLLVGGPIVARELETGTARLAWSLGPSRLRWFAQRVVPILLMFLVAGLAIGVTADALLNMVQPSVDLDASFVGFRARGLLVAVQGLLVASIALAVGRDPRSDRADDRPRAWSSSPGDRRRRGQGRDESCSRARPVAVGSDYSLHATTTCTSTAGCSCRTADRDLGGADRDHPEYHEMAGTRRAGSRTSRSTSPARATTSRAARGAGPASCSPRRFVAASAAVTVVRRRRRPAWTRRPDNRGRDERPSRLRSTPATACSTRLRRARRGRTAGAGRASRRRPGSGSPSRSAPGR